jgi:hypothetical protein
MHVQDALLLLRGIMHYEEISIRDHALLRRLLGILDGMVSTMEDGGRIEIADAVTLLNLLKFFEPEYHKMLDGVDEELSIAGLEEALHAKRAHAFVQGSRRLTLMLRDHLDSDGDAEEHLSSKLPKKENTLSLARLERKYEGETPSKPFRLDHERSHTPGPASYR